MACVCVAKRFLARAPSTLRGSAIRGLTVTHTTPVHTTPLTPPNTHFVRTFSDNAAEDVAAPTEEASPKVQALCDQLCELNVIEMNQLVNLFKDKVGLSGADVMPMMGAPMMGAPMPAMGAPAAGADGGAPQEEEAAPEKELWDLKLLGFDDKAKIKVIKEVRAISGLGLKEAKELVEGAPKIVKKEMSKADAEAMMEKLKEVGAQVELE